MPSIKAGRVYSPLDSKKAKLEAKHARDTARFDRIPNAWHQDADGWMKVGGKTFMQVGGIPHSMTCEELEEFRRRRFWEAYGVGPKIELPGWWSREVSMSWRRGRCRKINPR